MPANVVSLSVQTASGGFGIARRVAEALNFRYYDWEITSEAAARAGVTPTEVLAAEHVPGFVERMMRRLGAASAVSVESGPALNEISPAAWTAALQSLTSDDYRQFVERIVLEIADQGEAVIVGHAAQHTLRGRPGALRVLVHGTLELRAKRLAQEESISFDEALMRVRNSDKERGDLLKRVYHFDWLDAAMYDLCVNTDQLSEEFLADTIVAAVEKVP
jgi:cytidylate kinase